MYFSVFCGQVYTVGIVCVCCYLYTVLHNNVNVLSAVSAHLCVIPSLDPDPPHHFLCVSIAQFDCECFIYIFHCTSNYYIKLKKTC